MINLLGNIINCMRRQEQSTWKLRGRTLTWQLPRVSSTVTGTYVTYSQGNEPGARVILDWPISSWSIVACLCSPGTPCSQNKQVWSVSSCLQFSPEVFTFYYCSVLQSHSNNPGCTSVHLKSNPQLVGTQYIEDNKQGLELVHSTFRPEWAWPDPHIFGKKRERERDFFGGSSLNMYEVNYDTCIQINQNSLRAYILDIHDIYSIRIFMVHTWRQ
jgi:hypothetical protein